MECQGALSRESAGQVEGRTARGAQPSFFLLLRVCAMSTLREKTHPFLRHRTKTRCWGAWACPRTPRTGFALHCFYARFLSFPILCLTCVKMSQRTMGNRSLKNMVTTSARLEAPLLGRVSEHLSLPLFPWLSPQVFDLVASLIQHQHPCDVVSVVPAVQCRLAPSKLVLTSSTS